LVGLGCGDAGASEAVGLKMSADESVRRAVKDLQSGRDKEAAFRVLFDEYYERTVRFFMRKGMEREDARDLAQECFKNVLGGIEGFRGDSSFSTYLFTIASNLLRNRYRSGETRKRKGRRSSLEEMLERQGDGAIGTESAEQAGDALDQVIHRERLEQTLGCIDGLPAMPRRCLILHVLFDRTYKEIAALMGIASGTVGAHIFEARRRLRRCLEAAGTQSGEGGSESGSGRGRR
jgi:RNA polymerase sigma-70 factor (ECF subfamily)